MRISNIQKIIINMHKILVTGGTGYIGSHTSVELINAGYEVIIVDNLSNSSIEILDGIEQITGMRPEFEKFDLCDRTRVFQFLDKHQDIDSVIHFAALKAVSESVKLPLDYYHNNLLSLLNILSGLGKHKLISFVFSSSCTVYGEPDELPITEKAPIKFATSPYGNTKQISEEILHDTANVDNNLQVVSLRYFNPIGAHKSALIGELPIGTPLNLVPCVTQTAAGLRDQLLIYGNDYNTSDGTAVRDYIDVTDLAKAHVISIQRLIDRKNKSNFEVFNLGTGRGVSVMEIISTFESATGIKINYSIVNRRPGDVEKIWADTTYANTELGWKAESPLQDTLLSAWNWEKKIRGL